MAHASFILWVFFHILISCSRLQNLTSYRIFNDDILAGNMASNEPADGIHFWRLKKAGAVYFTPFLIGGIFQTIGYCGRIWSHFDKESIGGFVMQAILILVAPALFAASIYMILARLVRALGAEHLSLIPIKWVTKIFVTGDVFAFGLQAGGGGIQSAGTLQMYEMGEKIIIAGLFVQIAIFGFFVVTALLFHTRMIKTYGAGQLQRNVAWQRHLYVLYTTSALILIRSIFRVVEYLQGNDGYLISHEVFIYTMDALLMAIVMAIFAALYIGDLQPKKSSEGVSRSSETSDYPMTQRGGDSRSVRQHEVFESKV
jgi:hypothetical protein